MIKAVKYFYGIGCFILAILLYLDIIDTSNIKAILIIMLGSISFIALNMSDK